MCLIYEAYIVLIAKNYLYHRGMIHVLTRRICKKWQNMSNFDLGMCAFECNLYATQYPSLNTVIQLHALHSIYYKYWVWQPKFDKIILILGLTIYDWVDTYKCKGVSWIK